VGVGAGPVDGVSAGLAAAGEEAVFSILARTVIWFVIGVDGKAVVGSVSVAGSAPSVVDASVAACAPFTGGVGSVLGVKAGIVKLAHVPGVDPAVSASLVS
jgi:hypothetical protein